MLMKDLTNLNLSEIEEMIVNSKCEERAFYIQLYNKVLGMRWQNLVNEKEETIKKLEEQVQELKSELARVSSQNTK